MNMNMNGVAGEAPLWLSTPAALVGRPWAYGVAAAGIAVAAGYRLIGALRRRRGRGGLIDVGAD